MGGGLVSSLDVRMPNKTLRGRVVLGPGPRLKCLEHCSKSSPNSTSRVKMRSTVFELSIYDIPTRNSQSHS
jgi:hypothetical protein